MAKVIIRAFKDGENNILAQSFCVGMSDADILTMASEWRDIERESSCNEILAIQVDSELAGRVSLYEKEPGKISIVIKLISSYKNDNGIEKQAYQEITNYAKNLGYKTITEYVKKSSKFQIPANR